MKSVEGEKLITIITARRKGTGGVSRKTPFELGIGNVTDFRGRPTREIRIRTEQIASQVAPVVGTLTLSEARELLIGLQKAIVIAEQA